MRRHDQEGKAAATDFQTQLDVFRRQVAESTQFYYAGEAINEFAKRDKATFRALNRTPGFWLTASAALQFAAFTAVGRLFDSDRSSRTVYTLLSSAEQNLSVFSQQAIQERKIRDGVSRESSSALASRAYVPRLSDFARLRRLLRKHRKTYDAQFSAIRNRHLAHTVITEEGEIGALFSKTKRRDFERLLGFFNQLYDALWSLYHAGRRPSLRPQPFSCRSLARQAAIGRGSSDQEHIVHDTMVMLQLLTEAVEPRVGRVSAKRRGKRSRARTQ